MAVGTALSVRPVWLSPALEGRWQKQSGFCWSPISQLQTPGIPGHSQSLADGTIFPWHSQHLVMQHPPVLDPDLPGTSPTPSTCHSHTEAHPWCSCVLVPLGIWPVCVRAPLPLQLLSAWLRHPEHPFLLPGAALNILFPELFHPDFTRSQACWLWWHSLFD